MFGLAIWNFLTSDASLTHQQLQRLGQHKYKSSSASLLDRFLKPIWYELAEFYPKWLAPNILTISGLLMNVIGGATFAFYSPDAKTEAPRWVYFFCTLAMFLYQTLDATDGIQARRTKTSSVLGEFFDHGCDAISQVFIALQLCSCLQIGEKPDLVFLLFLVAAGIFYVAHWQIYVTGCMETQQVDATEGEYLFMSFLLATAWFGSHIWSKELLQIPLKYYVVAFSLTVVVMNVYFYMGHIFTAGAGKEGSTVADTSIIFPVIPLLSFLLPPIWIYRMAESNVIQDHIVIFCIGCGMVSAKLTMRIIIAGMSRSGLYLWDTIFWGYIILFLNYYFMMPLPELPCLYFFLIYCVISIFCYSYALAAQLCDYFNIQCFRIPYEQMM